MLIRAVAPSALALAAVAAACSSTGPGHPNKDHEAPAHRAPPELVTVDGGVMKYWVSKPAAWSADRSWPVVVVIPDAGRDFAGNLDAFVQAGADGEFVFVAPMVVTSGGARGYREAPGFRYSASDWAEVDRVGDYRFDEDGIAAVVADVATRFHGERRVFLTGWEAGGHTVWALVLRHPEWFRAVAPVTPNFQGRWLDAPPAPPAPAAPDPAPAIAVFVCGDPCMPPEQRTAIMTQTANAIAQTAARGLGNPAIQVVDGAPHGPLAAAVLAWFAGQRR
jgi:dienelactone hydrolase